MSGDPEVRVTPLTVIVEPTTETVPVEAVVLVSVGAVHPSGTATVTTPAVMGLDGV